MTALHLGDTVPAFALPDTDGAAHTAPLDDAPPATPLAVRSSCSLRCSPPV